MFLGVASESVILVGVRERNSFIQCVARILEPKEGRGEPAWGKGAREIDGQAVDGRG